MSGASPTPLRLATAGIGVVGVCFGMARYGYGYGLLLPDIRRDFDLSAAQLGAIGTSSYVAYLAATALTGALTVRIGARRTAVAAALVAATGMTVAALAQTPATFVAGILIAGTSAGIAYAPFADAVRAIPVSARGRVLSAINCGTGYGVALAAPIAILAGTAWRSAWGAFAAVALFAAVWAAFVVPGRREEPADWRTPAYAWTAVFCPRAFPLVTAGLLLGLGSATYWTFAVEHLTAAGALSSQASRSFLGVVGIASILATFSADLVSLLGAGRAYTTAMLAEATSLALLAVAPTSLAAALVSAVLFGAAYNAAVGIQAIWSTHLFSLRPSLGLSAALCANGLGLLLGTLTAGVFADRLGFTAVMAIAAAVIAFSSCLRPREAILASATRRAESAAVV